MNVKSATFWQMLSSAATLILGMAQVAILSRHYNASDFGTIAIVLAFISICQVFSDLGTSNYILHKTINSIELNSTIFWLGVLSSIGISIIALLIIPIIGYFYPYADLQYYLLLTLLLFLITGLFSQLQACYIKFGYVHLLAKIELTSRLVSFGLFFLLLMFSNVGIEIIIFATIILFFCKLILLWILAKPEWRPKFVFDKSYAISAWHYGIYQVGSQILNQVRLNMDVMILGLYSPASTLGQFSLAKQLINKPTALLNPLISRVAMHTLSKHHGNQAEFNTAFKKIYAINAILLALAFSLVVILSKEIVLFLYGYDKQDVAIFVIPLALFWLFRYLCGGLVGPVVQVLGITKRDFIWNIITLMAFLVVTIVSSQFGARELAYAMMGLQLVLMYFVYKFFFNKILDLKSFFKILFLSNVVAFSISYFIYQIIDLMTLSPLMTIITVSLLTSPLVLFLSQKIIVDIKSFFHLSDSRKGI
jgi:O-antigen/teichoic acid export membrane protein